MQFSRRPADLTGSVEKTGLYPDMQGGYADVWRCSYNGGEREEMVKKFHILSLKAWCLISLPRWLSSVLDY